MEGHWEPLPGNSWIEGIGSDLGFTFGSRIIFESSSFLGCFSQNNQLLYTYDSNYDCSSTFGLVAGVSSPNKTGPSFRIYPSVTSEVINISSKATVSQEIEVSIYNSTGQRVYSKRTEITDIEEVSVSVAQLNPGLYFLSIKDAEGRVSVQKIIKE